jgi:hypothetical protein
MHSPRDHLICALLTMGEGYHNFHHQFPMDYRNAFRWYQYDPTKWFIAGCQYVGLASHLREFPSNEIEKGALTMKLKELKEVQDALKWPIVSSELPVVLWETCKFSAWMSRPVLLIILCIICRPGRIENTCSCCRFGVHPRCFRIHRQASGREVTPHEERRQRYDGFFLWRGICTF